MGSERARTDRAGRHRVEAKRCGWCLLQNRMAEVCRVVTTTCPAGSYLVWGDSCGLAAGGSRARSSTMPSGASDGELDLLSALGLTAGEGATAVADLLADPTVDSTRACPASIPTSRRHAGGRRPAKHSCFPERCGGGRAERPSGHGRASKSSRGVYSTGPECT